MGKVDPSSYSQPELIKIQHVDIDWTVDFENHVLSGSALLYFDIIAESIEDILLDVRDIQIESVFVKTAAGEVPVNFQVSDTIKDIGSKLTVVLPTKTDGKITLLVKYKTSSNASALQWLTPEQTMGKKHPFLFSQCQAIHARSILPCQDTPAVKFTYDAVLKHPAELTGLMSAIRLSSNNGVTKFEQKVPIPSYLLAIAVGALVSHDVGPRSKVWAEPEQIDEAAEEFSGTDKFLQTAESICGPYVWKQYDLLVLPPSFPYGGMENPCLTFVTPTVIAGDKSLVDVVAHEISHSWTGNLVTNMNFEHFWLNEGFTVFVEGKILGRLHGDKFRDFHSIHGLSELVDTINGQLKDTPELTKLVVDLSNLGPDDAFSSVPYMKGSTFLRYLEDSLGGPEVFEPFLRSYLDKFKYKSLVTQDFKQYLYEYFNEKNSDALSKIDWDAWLYSEGMPPIIPKYDYSMAETCKNLANLWADKTVAEIMASPVIHEELSSVQVIEFLSQLLAKPQIVDLNNEKIQLLANTYKFNGTKNAEIRFRYMRLCIKARLMNMMDEILKFADSNFRMKFVRSIYRDLAEWPEAKPLAIANFEKVKDQMMAVCAYTIAKDLGLN
jgi:leukotriene-A4 hydrolase